MPFVGLTLLFSFPRIGMFWAARDNRPLVRAWGICLCCAPRIHESQFIELVAHGALRESYVQSSHTNSRLLNGCLIPVSQTHVPNLDGLGVLSTREECGGIRSNNARDLEGRRFGWSTRYIFTRNPFLVKAPSCM